MYLRHTGRARPTQRAGHTPSTPPVRARGLVLTPGRGCSHWICIMQVCAECSRIMILFLVLEGEERMCPATAQQVPPVPRQAGPSLAGASLRAQSSRVTGRVLFTWGPLSCEGDTRPQTSEF